MNDEAKLHVLLRSLRFYLTPEHPCNYLPDRQAVSVFVDPTAEITMDHYASLAEIGFRRSGEHVYRPDCKHCGLCIPVRVPVSEFKPNRSQRRCLNYNRDLRLVVRKPDFVAEHFDLYRRYMRQRHSGGGMDTDDPKAYQHVIGSSWSVTRIFELRMQQRLLAVAVVDVFTNGLSAVYTFFDPELAKRSLGVYAVLRQIQYANEQGMDWLYLGYWNPQSDKMTYKANYAPLEYFDGTQWRRLDKKTFPLQALSNE